MDRSNVGCEMKKKLSLMVDSLAGAACAMSDDIFDNPETGLAEYHACGLLTSYLESAGFAVEKGIYGLDTAFRAVYECGAGGPSIGLLCEYDAIEGLGHGCGHHIQGPAIVAAAAALKAVFDGCPYKLVVYGTPAEETIGGKILMLEKGAFRDIDVALMTHASPTSTVDVKSMAMQSYEVTFHGKSAHAAMNPEMGRSALDALLLACSGVEFMREHVRDEARMHYTIVSAGGPSNVVPAEAEGEFGIRSYDTEYVMSMAERLKNIFKGAALMADVSYEIREGTFFKAKIPLLSLNDLIMENAVAVGMPTIRPPREKTGSTDFGNVMYEIPGSCIRSAFVPEGTPAHSQDYLDAGKSQAAHDALANAAKVLALTAYDLISDPAKMAKVRDEFNAKRFGKQTV
ncbi:M20 family metallopeptidase [Cloacibacillus sp.]|uniref:M20 family metallopeptidase n=1 Tax=Cloacibacillus sp. TaxID=2049023 RepID=UPI0025C6DF93|nr:M20 family metallopeptidase [Cloacibacillus sp.]MCC8058012.1 M20 family metallopeptidase [Cloacibacillus sp.]